MTLIGFFENFGIIKIFIFENFGIIQQQIFENFGIIYSFPLVIGILYLPLHRIKLEKRWQKEYLGERSMSKC